MIKRVRWRAHLAEERPLIVGGDSAALVRMAEEFSMARRTLAQALQGLRFADRQEFCRLSAEVLPSNSKSERGTIIWEHFLAGRDFKPQ